MDFTNFSLQTMLTFLLVLSRTAGIFTLTPIFGMSQVPVRIRMGLAFALTIIFMPMIHIAGAIRYETVYLVVLMAREILVGLVIGFVCTLVFTGITMAGEFMDIQSGFSFATQLDPAMGANAAVIARFHNILAVLLFFVTNSHHILIRGMADSFQIAPVGQVVMNASVANGVLDLFAAIFLIALKISMPVVAAVFLADIALAIASKVVPQMNVLIVGFPLKLGVGLFALIIALPVIMGASKGLLGNLYGDVVNLTKMLVVR